MDMTAMNDDWSWLVYGINSMVIVDDDGDVWDRETISGLFRLRAPDQSRMGMSADEILANFGITYTA